MKKVLIALILGLTIFSATASEFENERERECEYDRNHPQPLPEPSTYAAVGFVTSAIAFSIYKNKRRN